ncbi:unnamed protein product [marine sediment metagenome]|uniref:Uncharacterized protein n=1 Tax=marine sediment metagenome TaxID=412755 RepID=X0YZU3_9ZZZZ
MAIDNAGNIKMGDGVWTNYVNVTAGGVLTPEGTATVEATNLVPTVEIDIGAHTVGFTQQTVTYNETTTTVDWKLGNKAIMTFGAGNIGTFAFTNPTNPCNVLLKIVQDGNGGGSRVVVDKASVVLL